MGRTWALAAGLWAAPLTGGSAVPGPSEALLLCASDAGGCDTVPSISLLQRSAAGVEISAQAAIQAPPTSATSSYHWPSGRGRPGSYSASPHAGPRGPLARSLAWSWHHPEGRFHTLTFGTAIDGESNIYLTAADGIRKFTADGHLLWSSFPLSSKGEISNAASLMDGVVYDSGTNGEVFGIDMATGEPLWVTKVSDKIDDTNGFVSAHDGIVVAGTHATNSNNLVTGLNATTGAVLWDFQPDAPLWNFMASFPDDGTFTFQDLEGRAYRCKLADGSLVWKAGGAAGTWTDGSSLLGPNGVVYAVNTFHNFSVLAADAPGMLSAYRLADGKLLWNRTMPRPPNNMPGIGNIRGHGLTVIQPVGQQVLQNAPTDVYALDAETGELRWVFNGPAQRGQLQAGDALGIPERLAAGHRSLCLPNPWSAPTVDAAGVVYIGSEEGNFYALQDLNGDGRVFGEGEVDSYDTLAAFPGSAGPSHAPGLLAVASCDSLFVFRGDSS